MAKAGDEIFNPRTGQRMIFLRTGTETGGELVQIEAYNPPTGVAEPEHVHPFQESGAEVISGSLRFRVGGQERSVKAGESITIPANTPHNFWNDGEEEAHAVQCFRPALKIDEFFEMLFGLAQDGKLNDKGLPSLLQLAVGVPYFGDKAHQPAVGCAEGALCDTRTFRKVTRLPGAVPLSSDQEARKHCSVERRRESKFHPPFKRRCDR